MNSTVDEAARKANEDGSIDKAKGHTKEVIGNLKEKVGGFIGDHELEAKGHAQNLEGKAQRAKGEVKEAVHDVAEKIKAGISVINDKIEQTLHKQ